MGKTTGLSLEELQAKRKELIAAGKELSTSKELGKVEQAIKVLNPSKYSDEQVASAQRNLKLINEPVVSGVGAVGTSPTPSTGDSGVSALESLLAKKQDALIKATKDVNDNPWYSEATRTGKLNKLNNIAQLEITNLQNQIAQKREDEKLTAETSKPQLQSVTNDSGDVTIYDMKTGQVVNTIKGIGNAQTPSADPEEKAFDSAISDGIAQLQKGENWGTVWLRIKTRFPSVPDILIDNGLGTAWRNAGAYQTYKAQQPASGTQQIIDAINNAQ